MQEYATRLKALNGLNLRINRTKYASVITTSLAIKRLASAGGYD